MARKNIALLYAADYNQTTGIVIYLQNIVRHFLSMEDAIKPHLIILYTSNSPVAELQQIGYPYIDFIQTDKKPSIAVRAINKIGRVLTGKPLFNPAVNADIAYPSLPMELLRKVERHIYWKEDFQENYYPQYFSEGAFSFVKDFFKALQSRPSNKLVLSSFAAGKDLKQFYPEVNSPVHYLRFVSLLPEIDDTQLNEVMLKFGIAERYFIVSNQFWPHKNHALLLEAMRLLKEEGIRNYKIVLTGKTTSTRDPDYFPSLQRFIKEHDLGNQIIITGFLPRAEQLLLMKHALAVIQPSLFEGWSTVIEDAKALNQYILAADLPVNMEQLEMNASFFGQHDAKQLADLMKDVLEGKLHTAPLDYKKQISDFRKSLATLFELTDHTKSN